MKSLDVLLVHPYKHHAFDMAVGILDSTPSCQFAFPLYLKGLGKYTSLLPGSVGSRAMGYENKKIPLSFIHSPTLWQVRKLYSFFNHPRDIEKEYDKYISNLLRKKYWSPKIIITLQDHLSQTMAVAKDLGIKVWSDQIVNMSNDAQGRIEKHCKKSNIKYEWWDESRNDKVLGLSDIVTVPSQYVANGISSRVRIGADITTIPYGVDIDRFNLPKNTDKDVITIVARANSVRKGGHLLIEALNNIGSNLLRLAGGAKIKIIFLGRIESDLRKSYEDLKIKSKLNISEGNIPHSEMPSFYSKADLFIMPTLSEGMSLAIPEAMAARVPILTTKFSGVDMLETKVCGLFFEDSINSIEFALMDAIENRSSWNKWGDSCSDAISGHGLGSYYNKISSLVNKNINL